VTTVTTRERTLFVAGGSVDGTVDFGRIGSGAVRVSDDRRTVSVTLPHATLSKPHLDPARSYVHDREANTSRMLQSLLRSLGFTEVTITFD
jgi:hypothetical protein